MKETIRSSARTTRSRRKIYLRDSFSGGALLQGGCVRVCLSMGPCRRVSQSEIDVVLGRGPEKICEEQFF